MQHPQIAPNINSKNPQHDDAHQVIGHGQQHRQLEQATMIMTRDLCQQQDFTAARQNC